MLEFIETIDDIDLALAEDDYDDSYWDYYDELDDDVRRDIDGDYYRQLLHK